MSDSLEDDWKDVRPGPEVPEHPPEPPAPPAPSLAERARALHEALILLAEITQKPNKAEFSIKIVNTTRDFATVTARSSIGAAIEDITAQVQAEIATRVKWARDAQAQQRKSHADAETELARVERLLEEYRK